VEESCDQPVHVYSEQWYKWWLWLDKESNYYYWFYTKGLHLYNLHTRSVNLANEIEQKGKE